MRYAHEKKFKKNIEQHILYHTEFCIILLKLTSRGLKRTGKKDIDSLL